MLEWYKRRSELHDVNLEDHVRNITSGNPNEVNLGHSIITRGFIDYEDAEWGKLQRCGAREAIKERLMVEVQVEAARLVCSDYMYVDERLYLYELCGQLGRTSHVVEMRRPLIDAHDEIRALREEAAAISPTCNREEPKEQTLLNYKKRVNEVLLTLIPNLVEMLVSYELLGALTDRAAAYQTAVIVLLAGKETGATRDDVRNY